MKAQGERRYSSYSFMTSALDGVSGQRHESSALYPQGRTPGTHLAGGWLGLRSGLDTEARRKILCLFLGSNPGRPAYSQTLYWLSYPGCYVVNRDQEFSAMLPQRRIKWHRCSQRQIPRIKRKRMQKELRFSSQAASIVVLRAVLKLWSW
jgi:hypothetical protein